MLNNLSLIEQIKTLNNKLIKYNFEYYILSTPSISDNEYDNLVLELNRLQKIYNKLNNTSIDLSLSLPLNLNSSFTVKHYSPMLSLNNVYNEQQFLHFYNNLLKKINLKINYPLEMFCDLKIDGIAINLLYEEGKLIKSSTRGNGLFGEDITNNIKLVTSIPKQINLNQIFYNKNICPKRIEIRGEIYISKKEFEILQNNPSLIKIKDNKQIFSNPRNFASGSIRNNNNLVKPFLSFLAYNLFFIDHNQQINNYFFNTQLSKIKLLKTLNFNTCKFTRLCNLNDEIINYYKKVLLFRSKLNYEIDGIVIKVNSLKYQSILGNNNKYPKWAIAFKFPAQTKLSFVKQINYQITRKGELVPIAIINPIKIGGVTIKKVNLYNLNEIKRLKLHLNETVFIKRAGDVIPKIIKTIPFLSTKLNIKNIVIPKICSFCNNKLKIQQTNNGLILQCLKSIKCKGQLIQLLLHFVSKNAFNIKYLGINLLTKLVNFNVINYPYDIFGLNNTKLAKIGLTSYKIQHKLLLAINNAKIIHFSNFIYSLSIPMVGLISAKILINKFVTIQQLMEADLNTLKTIKNLGQKISENIYNYFQNSYNKDMILLLLSYINIVY